MTSDLVLLETRVRPLREKDDLLDRLYSELLLESHEVQLLPIERRIIERATRIRAESRVRTPDAIHAATAQEFGCVLFLTNDARLGRVPELPVCGRWRL